MDDDVEKILKVFGAWNIKKVQTPKVILPSIPPAYDYYNTTATDMIKSSYEESYEITISMKNIMHIARMLKSKGYYHDEDYRKRMAEEELIMTNPVLKQLHDQYKMYLYMLCGEDYPQ